MVAQQAGVVFLVLYLAVAIPMLWYMEKIWRKIRIRAIYSFSLAGFFFVLSGLQFLFLLDPTSIASGVRDLIALLQGVCLLVGFRDLLRWLQ